MGNILSTTPDILSQTEVFFPIWKDGSDKIKFEKNNQSELHMSVNTIMLLNVPDVVVVSPVSHNTSAEKHNIYDRYGFMR